MFQCQYLGSFCWIISDLLFGAPWSFPGIPRRPGPSATGNYSYFNFVASPKVFTCYSSVLLQLKFITSNLIIMEND